MDKIYHAYYWWVVQSSHEESPVKLTKSRKGREYRSAVCISDHVHREGCWLLGGIPASFLRSLHLAADIGLVSEQSQYVFTRDSRMR